MDEKRRLVLVCPRCGEVTDTGEGWEESFTEATVWSVAIDQKELWVDIKDLKDVIVRTHEKTFHKCGFETEKFRAEEFGLVLQENKIVEICPFWEENMDKLREIAKKKGWVIEGEQ